MRQIHVGAWIALTLAACGGGKFSTPDSSGPAASIGSAGSASVGNPQVAGGGGGGAKRTDSEGSEIHSAGATDDAHSGGQGPSAPIDTNGPDEPTGMGSGGADGDCPTDVVTFRMLPSARLAPDYLCDAGCGTGWLSISDKDGATGLPISSACGTASCESCEVVQCAAAACLASPLTAHGSELSWDGTYLAKDSCGTNKMVCQRRDCVAPGKYKARACAAVSAGPSMGGSCVPTEQRLCAEVEFEFPATKTVELILGQ